MPTVAEIIFNNINHIKEKAFVHATFWYEKMNGSQYIADKLAEGINIHYNANIESIFIRKKSGVFAAKSLKKLFFAEIFSSYLLLLKVWI